MADFNEIYDVFGLAEPCVLSHTLISVVNNRLYVDRF